jgi:pimeloyl-ACP methyl ester carboxylesterase
MTPPTRRSLELPGRGVELSLLDFGGTGSPVVLSHANGFCAALWAPIAEQLRARHRVFAYDARGHGHSSKPAPPEPYRWNEFVADLLTVSEHVVREVGPAGGAPTRIIAIGHSFGGTTALTAAARVPERFARVGMLDPVLFPPRPPEESLRPGAPSQIVNAALRRRARFASRQEIRERYRARDPFSLWDPRVFSLYVEEAFEAQPDGSVTLRCPGAIEAAIYQMNDLDIMAEAEKLRCPALLLYAAHGTFPRERAVELARRAQGIELEDFPATHLLAMEAPDRLAERLTRFVMED